MQRDWTGIEMQFPKKRKYTHLTRGRPVDLGNHMRGGQAAACHHGTLNLNEAQGVMFVISSHIMCRVRHEWTAELGCFCSDPGHQSAPPPTHTHT